MKSQYADYMVLKQGTVILTQERPKLSVRPFKLPREIIRDKPAILSLTADPSPDANLTCEIRINRKLVRRRNFMNGHERAIWECIGSRVLRPDRNNLEIRRLEGDGVIMLKDIILWFRRSEL